MSAELVYNVKFNIDASEKKKITDIGTAAPVKLTIDDTQFEKEFQELRGDLKAKVFLEADAKQVKATIDAVDIGDKSVGITPFLDIEQLYSLSDRVDKYFSSVQIKFSQESISNLRVQLAPLFASRIIDIGFSIQEANLDSLSQKISSIKQSIESVRSLFSEVDSASVDANVSISFFADRINEVDTNALQKINEVGLSLQNIGQGFESLSTNLGSISSSLSGFSSDISENMLSIKMLADNSDDLNESAIGAAAGFDKFKEAVSNFRALNNVNKKLKESIKLLKEFSDITSVSVSSEAVDELTRNYEEVSSALEKATKELDDYKKKVDELSQSAAKQVSDNSKIEQSVENVSNSKKEAASEAEELSFKFREVSREEMNALMESARMEEKAARNRDKFSNSTEQLTDKQEQLRGVFFQEEQELKTLSAETSNYVAEVRKMVTTGVKDVNVLQQKIDRLNESRKLLEDQIALVTGLANATELSSKEQEGANKALAQGQRASRASVSTTKAYENSMHMLIDTQGDLTRQAGLANKQFSAINQSIFSFGDLVQDASQFQFGFAQGMRAVGNNIAFTAELFAVSQANIERHNKAVADGTLKGAEQTTMFQAFKKQLIGPTGVVLAVNLAVTAISLLSNAFKKTSEEAEDAMSVLDEFIKASAAIRDMGAEDFLGVQSLERQSRVIDRAILSIDALDESYTKYTENLRKVSAMAASGVGFSQSTVSAQRQYDALVVLDEQLERLKENYGGFLDENNKLIVSQEELREKLKDTRAELALRIALRDLDPLAEFRDSTSATVTNLGILNKAGHDNEQQIRSQIKAYEAQKDGLLAITLQLDETSEAYETNIALISILVKAISDLEGNLDKGSKSTKKLSDEFKGLQERMRNALAEMGRIELVKNFGEASGDAAFLIYEQAEAMIDLRQEMREAIEEFPEAEGAFINLRNILTSLNEAQVVDFGRSLSEVFDEPKNEVEELTKQYEENRDALLLLIGAQEKGSSVYNELIQQLLGLQQGYKDSKDAIVLSNRAELQSSIAVQRALLDQGEYYADATELIQQHRFALDNAVEGNEKYEQTLSELQAQNFIQDIFSQYATVNDELEEFNRIVDEQREALLLLQQVFPNLVPQEVIDRFDQISQRQKETAANQEIVNGLMAARELVDAGAVFAEMFGASKDFQIALATTSGLLAIVQTLADPNNPTFLGKLAASATIAATVAKQIQAIKDTNIGGAKDVEAPSAPSFGEGSSITEAPRPVQNISFAPTSQSDGAVIVVNNEVVASASELAVLTRVGERDLANSQKTIR